MEDEGWHRTSRLLPRRLSEYLQVDPILFCEILTLFFSRCCVEALVRFIVVIAFCFILCLCCCYGTYIMNIGEIGRNWTNGLDASGRHMKIGWITRLGRDDACYVSDEGRFSFILRVSRRSTSIINAKDGWRISLHFFLNHLPSHPPPYNE